MFHLFSIGQMLQLRIVQGSARETAQSRQHSLSSVSHSMFGVSAKKAYSDQCLFICVVSRILEANVSAARRCYVATWLLCGSRCSSPQLRGLGYPGIQRFRQFKQEKSASLIQVLTWVKRRIQLSLPVPQTVNFRIYIVQQQAWVSEPCTKWCFWDKEIITPGSDGLDSRSSMPGCQIWVQSAKFRFAWWLHIDRWTWRPVLGLSGRGGGERTSTCQYHPLPLVSIKAIAQSAVLPAARNPGGEQPSPTPNPETTGAVRKLDLG